MNQYPNELRYTSTHEWVKIEKDNTITVGITEHAQHQLGDLVYVELPELNKQVTAGKELAVVESVKTAADVYSPADGAVIAINESLRKNPELVNQDPYGNGWLFRLKINNAPELEKLLDAHKYQIMVEGSN
ncbi:MAG: glycine cleavage system protein GcvH [Proteobacteria bacterium]|nr:glycine cleavage system protein GcvH [Pseudomonadota bacterium]